MIFEYDALPRGGSQPARQGPHTWSTSVRALGCMNHDCRLRWVGHACNCLGSAQVVPCVGCMSMLVVLETTGFSWDFVTSFCHFLTALVTVELQLCRQLTLANSLIVATRLILSIPQLRYSNLARESRYHPKTRKDHTKHSSMASQPAHTNDDKVKRRSTRRAGAAQHR
jgi:hypothetical protein